MFLESTFQLHMKKICTTVKEYPAQKKGGDLISETGFIHQNINRWWPLLGIRSFIKTPLMIFCDCCTVCSYKIVYICFFSKVITHTLFS